MVQEIIARIDKLGFITLKGFCISLHLKASAQQAAGDRLRGWAHSLQNERKSFPDVHLGDINTQNIFKIKIETSPPSKPNTSIRRQFSKEKL